VGQRFEGYAERRELMINKLKLFFYKHPWEIAIVAILFDVIDNIYRQSLETGAINILKVLKGSLFDLVFYVIVTPIWMGLYFVSKKQQFKKESRIGEVQEIFTLKNYLIFFAIYVFAVLLIRQILPHIFK